MLGIVFVTHYLIYPQNNYLERGSVLLMRKLTLRLINLLKVLQFQMAEAEFKVTYA